MIRPSGQQQAGSGEQSSAAERSLAPGTVLGDAYRVIKTLSSTARDKLYLCEDISAPESRVVLKLLPEPVPGEDNETSKARFEREIYALYKLRHPNIVQVHELFEADSVLAYTMEFVAGGSLASRLEQGAPLDAGTAALILLQLSSAVEMVHAAGILHRAIKPKNVLFADEETVKLSGFGVAKLNNSTKLTAHGLIVGTMEYIPPEYLFEGTLDESIDLYALGVIGYQMLTGKVPFQSENFVQMALNRKQNQVESLLRLNPACPPALSEVIAAALHPDPQARFQSASDLHRALADCVPGHRARPAAAALLDDDGFSKDFRWVWDAFQIGSAFLLGIAIAGAMLTLML